MAAGGGESMTMEQIEASNAEQVDSTTVEQILGMRSLFSAARKRQADVRRQMLCRGRINQTFVDWTKFSVEKDDIPSTLRRSRSRFHAASS